MHLNPQRRTRQVLANSAGQGSAELPISASRPRWKPRVAGGKFWVCRRRESLGRRELDCARETPFYTQANFVTRSDLCGIRLVVPEYGSMSDLSKSAQSSQVRLLRCWPSSAAKTGLLLMG